MNTLTHPPTTHEYLREYPLPVPAKQVSAIAVGDCTGDGQLDTVLRYTENNRIKLCLISGSGETLWHYDTGLPARGGWDGRDHHCPFLCWDMNGDGRCEVVLHDAGSAWEEYHQTQGDDVFYEVGMPTGERLVVLDGLTGAVIQQAPWPAWKARVMMTVALLDGPEAPPSW